jgi:diguanylate cyclase (GGDEF)-like protein
VADDQDRGRREAAPAQQDSAGAAGHLADENALLRASMAELRERMSELEELSESDPLTGLPNRRRFLVEIQRVVAHASRHGIPADLLYIDLEGISPINAAHGRMAGDAALIHAARLLSRLIRSTDVLARIGGDQFALILDHLDHNSAIETAERLARCISESPLDLGGSQVAIAATIGTATILPGDSVEEVIQRADRNMCRAKAEA